jgi:glycosyltransferase involved in cell wall biosynthesis
MAEKGARLGDGLNNLHPAISVIMPVYNAEGYLPAAVESVLTQTFADFEFLALDDGSTDRSLSILRAYEKNDSRLRVLTRENRGLVASLNELIDAARGRYLARMDSDDICRPQRFAKQISYLEDHPACVAVGSRVLFIDPEGNPIFEAPNELTHEEIDAAHMSGDLTMRICHPSVLMRKAAVVGVGKYRQEFDVGEDWDLFLRLAEVGRLANLSQVLFEYRQHLGAACYSNARRDVSPKFVKRAVEDAAERRGLAINPETLGTPVDLETPAQTHRKWAWCALSAGHLATARRHALRAVAAEPMSIESLRVFACAIRGH